MPAIFCCPSLRSYRSRQLDYEAKFRTFTSWADLQTTSLISADDSLVSIALYAVQLVKQINYESQKSIKYFVSASNDSDFAETNEVDLLKSNFENWIRIWLWTVLMIRDFVLTVKYCRYKNFRREKHNIIFEINLYQKNTINTHHWRINLERSSTDIDLAFRRKNTEAESSNKVEKSIEQEKKRIFHSLTYKTKLHFRTCVNEWHRNDFLNSFVVSLLVRFKNAYI